jgi:hypothetical protein
VLTIDNVAEPAPALACKKINVENSCLNLLAFKKGSVIHMGCFLRSAAPYQMKLKDENENTSYLNYFCASILDAVSEICNFFWCE